MTSRNRIVIGVLAAREVPLDTKAAWQPSFAELAYTAAEGKPNRPRPEMKLPSLWGRAHERRHGRDSLPPRRRRVPAALDRGCTTSARETFVVEVHEDGGALAENVRTRECVRLGQLSEIAVHISSWLKEPERHGTDGLASERPAPTRPITPRPSQ